MATLNDRLEPSNAWGWIVPGVFVKGNKNIDEYLLVDEDPLKLTQFLLGHAKSKFDEFTIFSEYLDGVDECITSLAILNDGNIEFPTLGISLNVSRGDMLTFLSELLFIPQVKHIQKKFSFSRTKKSFGSGSKTFKIDALIRDHYTININAETKEEALEIANSIDISEWKHPDLPEDLHLTDRRIVRHARWGNLTVEEVE